MNVKTCNFGSGAACNLQSILLLNKFSGVGAKVVESGTNTTAHVW